MRNTILVAASRFGARLGNWNDRRHGSLAGPAHRSRLWRPIDRIADRLYVLGDRAQEEETPNG